MSVFDEIREAKAGATPGPWVQNMPDTTWVMAGSLHVATIPRAADGDWSPANARLIALAPRMAEIALAVGELLPFLREMQDGGAVDAERFDARLNALIAACGEDQ